MKTTDETALHLVGIVRGERRRIPLREPRDGSSPVRAVRFRDLAVLLRSGPPTTAGTDSDDILMHHRAVERAMQRRTVVPAPWGVVLDGPEQAEELLRAHYVELDQALALLEGRWEMRLHLRPADLASAAEEWPARRTAVYNELRRIARAAVPSAPDERREFAASFLVDRAASDAFADRVQELRERFPELRMEVTGPWPPYDFIHFGLR